MSDPRPAGNAGTKSHAAAASGGGIRRIARTSALTLYIVEFVGVFVVGYPGFFAFDAIWPGFYYSPFAAGKNAWVLSQAFFIGVYVVALS